VATESRTSTIEDGDRLTGSRPMSLRVWIKEDGSRMDGKDFDSLAKSLAVSGTRRRLVRLLSVLPLGVTLTAMLGDEPETISAKKNKKQETDDDHGSSHCRHRRNAEHRHQTGNNKEHRQGKRKGKDKDQGQRRTKCVPDSLAHTCAGKCAKMINNCGAQVECGSCVCTPLCAECEVCNDRTGRCEPRPANEACGPAATCVNGVETPRDGCDGAGSCQPGSPRDCDPFPCDGDACATTCGSDDDCVDDAFCDGNDHCVAKKNLGEACGREDECLSGLCQQDVCCESACRTEDCHECNQPGSEGQCVEVDSFCF
jgi:hypothetical protein